MPCGCKKGSGMYVHGGGFKKRKKRRRKKKGSGMGFSGSGAMFPAVRAGVNAFRAVRSQMRPRFARARFVGTKRGSGRFLPGVTWHKGSGMGFSGSGMSFHGSGLRGKRIAFRQGSGRRMI